MATATEKEIHDKPPYISFRTLTTLLDKLTQDGIPGKFDRSYWKSFLAGGYGPLVVASLRFLGLLDDQDRPTERLEQLVHQKEGRPEIMAAVIYDKYAPALKDLDLTRATIGMVDAGFKEGFGLEGNTLRKARTFLIHASKFSNITLSAHVLRSARKGRPPKMSKPGATKPRSKALGGRPTPPPPAGGNGASAANTKTVSLRSGGSVQLTVDVDWFTVDPNDRQFCLELIDRLREYDEEELPSGDASPDDEAEGDAPD